MAKDNAYPMIAEYYRLMESLKDRPELYVDLVDFTPLTYTPFLDEGLAKEMPIVIICIMSIIGQPFYVNNLKTFDIIKSRFNKVKAIPGYLDAVKDSIEAGDQLN